MRWIGFVANEVNYTGKALDATYIHIVTCGKQNTLNNLQLTLQMNVVLHVVCSDTFNYACIVLGVGGVRVVVFYTTWPAPQK